MAHNSAPHKQMWRKRLLQILEHPLRVSVMALKSLWAGRKMVLTQILLMLRMIYSQASAEKLFLLAVKRTTPSSLLMVEVVLLMNLLYILVN